MSTAVIDRPGLFFGLSVKKAMNESRPDELDRLEALGIVSYEWIGDDHSGVGDWYPAYKRRHSTLVELAHQARSTLMKAAQCGACSEKWDLDPRQDEHCKSCFFGDDSRVMWCWNWPLPKQEVA